MNIYYLGPDNSYSHILVKEVFPSSTPLISCASFHEIITSVLSDDVGIGALAIENSITSSVHQTVDLLYNSRVCIVGEASMHITMNLIGTSGATTASVKEIYSHPQALAQCSEYIASHNITTHESPSTTAAMHYIAKKNNPTVAAIGSVALPGLGLKMLEKDIANAPNNMTRWVFIAKEGTAALGKTINKLTYIFKVKHVSGSLVDVLTQIAKLKGNLTKIESRPLPGSHWEYGFWIDVEIDESVKEQFHAMMKASTLECRCVGAYERGRLFS